MNAVINVLGDHKLKKKKMNFLKIHRNVLLNRMTSNSLSSY